MSLDYPDRKVWLAKRTKSHTLQKTASLRERYIHVSVNVWTTDDKDETTGVITTNYHRTARGNGVSYKKKVA